MNKKEIETIVRLMFRGTEFVELSTYLHNHTSLEGNSFEAVQEILSSIQKHLKEALAIAAKAIAIAEAVDTENLYRQEDDEPWWNR